MSNFKEVLKATTGLIFTAGISAFFGNATATIITKTGMPVIDAVLTGIGANAISCYISSKATENDAKKIDEVFEAIEKVIDKKEDTDEYTGQGDVSTEQPQE